MVYVATEGEIFAANKVVVVTEHESLKHEYTYQAADDIITVYNNYVVIDSKSEGIIIPSRYVLYIHMSDILDREEREEVLYVEKEEGKVRKKIRKEEELW